MITKEQLESSKEIININEKLSEPCIVVELSYFKEIIETIEKQREIIGIFDKHMKQSCRGKDDNCKDDCKTCKLFVKWAENFEKPDKDLEAMEKSLRRVENG